MIKKIIQSDLLPRQYQKVQSILLAYKETSHTTDEVRSVKLFPGLFLENLISLCGQITWCAPLFQI